MYGNVYHIWFGGETWIFCISWFYINCIWHLAHQRDFCSIDFLSCLSLIWYQSYVTLVSSIIVKDIFVLQFHVIFSRFLWQMLRVFPGKRSNPWMLHKSKISCLIFALYTPDFFCISSAYSPGENTWLDDESDFSIWEIRKWKMDICYMKIYQNIHFYTISTEVGGPRYQECEGRYHLFMYSEHVENHESLQDTEQFRPWILTSSPYLASILIPCVLCFTSGLWLTGHHYNHFVLFAKLSSWLDQRMPLQLKWIVPCQLANSAECRWNIMRKNQKV